MSIQVICELISVSYDRFDDGDNAEFVFQTEFVLSDECETMFDACRNVHAKTDARFREIQKAEKLYARSDRAISFYRRLVDCANEKSVVDAVYDRRDAGFSSHLIVGWDSHGMQWSS